MYWYQKGEIKIRIANKLIPESVASKVIANVWKLGTHWILRKIQCAANTTYNRDLLLNLIIFLHILN